MSAVKEAVKLAQPATGDLSLIEREAIALNERARNLLPVENQAKAAITARMAELRTQTEQLKIARATQGCPMIPLDVLSWTSGYSTKIRGKAFAADLLRPQLAVVPVDDNRAEMRFTANGYCEIRPHLPDAMEKQYSAVARRLAQVSKDTDNRIEMAFRYRGAIPDETRQKISDARSDFDQIYLVCDAPEWEITTERNPRPPRFQYLDPIVVGYAAEAMWMIDVFDPTPIEQYIAMEWALKPADEQRAIERG